MFIVNIVVVQELFRMRSGEAVCCAAEALEENSLRDVAGDQRWSEPGGCRWLWTVTRKEKRKNRVFPSTTTPSRAHTAHLIVITSTTFSSTRDSFLGFHLLELICICVLVGPEEDGRVHRYPDAITLCQR